MITAMKNPGSICEDRTDKCMVVQACDPRRLRQDNLKFETNLGFLARNLKEMGFLVGRHVPRALLCSGIVLS